MERLHELFRLYYNKQATSEETKELMQLVKVAPPEVLENLIVACGEQLERMDYSISAEKTELILNEILQFKGGREVEFDNATIRQFDNGESSTGGIEVPENNEVEAKVKVKRMQILKWVAAASIIGFVIWSLLFVINRDEGSDLPMADSPKVEDVKAPEVNRAMITLADGRKVYLDSVGIGSLANVSGVEVVKLEDGKIVYRRESSIVNSEMVYNTLTNPRGSRVIDITLSDGSRVWLNAGSSIKYPVAFNDQERKVEMTGEGYFEVAKDPKKKFIVDANGTSTEVLGTHFNINAYEDEGEIKVTLLEGSVNVKPPAPKGGDDNPSKGVILRPGQQATLRQAQGDKMSNELSVMSGVDTEEVMAWKNGVFQLKGTEIEDLMREIARWYDVDVVYSGGPVKQVFYGTIPRTVSAANVFKVLEETGGVHFIIEGRKVTVMP